MTTTNQVDLIGDDCNNIILGYMEDIDLSNEFNKCIKEISMIKNRKDKNHRVYHLKRNGNVICMSRKGRCMITRCFSDTNMDLKGSRCRKTVVSGGDNGNWRN